MKTQQAALAALLRGSRAKPFAWGVHDCCTFAADCIAAQTGIDVMAGIRGRYSTELGAKRVLAKEGLSLRTLPDQHFTPITYSFSQFGDLVLIETEQGEAMSIKHARGVWVISETGGRVLPKPQVLRCWRIE